MLTFICESLKTAVINGFRISPLKIRSFQISRKKITAKFKFGAYLSRRNAPQFQISIWRQKSWPNSNFPPQPVSKFQISYQNFPPQICHNFKFPARFNQNFKIGTKILEIFKFGSRISRLNRQIFQIGGKIPRKFKFGT